MKHAEGAPVSTIMLTLKKCIPSFELLGVTEAPRSLAGYFSDWLEAWVSNTVLGDRG